MKNFILIILLGFMLWDTGNAQFNYHRTYPAQNNENFRLLDGVVDGQNTYILATIMPDEPGLSEALMLASFDYKGNELWVQRLEFTGIDQILDVGELILASNDSLYFTALIDTEDENAYRIIGSYGKKGNLGQTRIMTDSVDIQSEIVTYHLADNIKGHYLTGTVMERGDTIGFILSRETYFSNTTWSMEYRAFDTLNNNLRIATRNISTFYVDSTITIGGNIPDNNGISVDAFISKLDTNGIVQWSRSYSQEGGTLYNLTDMHELPDSSFLVSGSLAGGDGFLMALDSVGGVIWSKQASLGDTVNTFLNHVTVNAEGHIVTSGVAMSTDTLYSYILMLDRGGNIIFQKKYPRTKAFQNLNGDLIADEMGMTYLFGTSNAYEDNINVPEIIKVDQKGESFCADSLIGMTLTDIIVLTDTLILETRNIALGYEIIESSDDFPLTLDIPILSLESVPFCPEEPIDYTFDPMVQGATSYLWSDGSTADTLRVMEEGDYSVTVTVDENICFMLCDTGRISVYDYPTLQAAPDFSSFCSDGTGRMRVSYTGDAPLMSIDWSTGASDVNFITIPADGTYSVTVTDICGETADTSINITLPTLISEINTSLDDDYCSNNGILLSVTANAPIETYTWSNASVTNTITVNLPGIYNVTVTDICGNEFSESVDVDASLIKEITNVQITPSGDNVCVINELNLTVSYLGTASTIQWNKNDNGTETITVNDPDSYTVTLTDECGKTYEDTQVVSECPDALKYPKVFFPQGEEELNQTFGPTLLVDGALISNYEFFVYNRWGQKVFESSSLSDEWDGNHNGDPAPSGVYVYYAKYNIGLGEQILKGDITLLR